MTTKPDSIIELFEHCGGYTNAEEHSFCDEVELRRFYEAAKQQGRDERDREAEKQEPVAVATKDTVDWANDDNSYIGPLYRSPMPAAVVPDELREKLNNLANNLGEFAGAMPTQTLADDVTRYAQQVFDLLAAAPAQPAALTKCDGDHAANIPCTDKECWLLPAPAQPAEAMPEWGVLAEQCALDAMKTLSMECAKLNQHGAITLCHGFLKLLTEAQPAAPLSDKKDG